MKFLRGGLLGAGLALCASSIFMFFAGVVMAMGDMGTWEPFYWALGLGVPGAFLVSAVEYEE